jgi:hypothetical protein
MNRALPSREVAPRSRGAGLRNARNGASALADRKPQRLHTSLGNQGVLRRLEAEGILNRPGDRFEHEADAMSQEALRGSGGCTCGSCSRCKEKAGAKHAKPGVAASAPAEVHEALRTPGQALDPATRSFMESRLGHDFSGVRIHTDAAAAQSAKAIQASAWTAGHDIFFANGKFSPAASSSRALLAHELAHVGQQGERKPAIQRAPDSEADRVAARKEATEAIEAMNREEALDDAKEKAEEEEAARKSRPRPIGIPTLDPKTLCGGRPCMTDEDLKAIEKQARKELDAELKRLDDIDDEIRKTPYKTRLNEARSRIWTMRGDYGVLSTLSAEEVWNAGDFLPLEKSAVYKDQGEILKRGEEQRTQNRKQNEVQREVAWEAQGDAVLNQSQSLFFQPFLGGPLGLAGAAYDGSQMGLMVGQTVNACRDGTSDCVQAALPLFIGAATHRVMKGGKIGEGVETGTGEATIENQVDMRGIGDREGNRTIRGDSDPTPRPDQTNAPKTSLDPQTTPPKGSAKPIQEQAHGPVPLAERPTATALEVKKGDLLGRKQTINKKLVDLENAAKSAGDMIDTFEGREPTKAKGRENLAAAERNLPIYEEQIKALREELKGIDKEMTIVNEDLQTAMKLQVAVGDVVPYRTPHGGVEVPSYSKDYFLGTDPANYRAELETILNSNSNGELSQALLENKELNPARQGGQDMNYLKDHPEVIEASHVLTKGGGPDVLMVESSYKNQMRNNNLLEKKGGVVLADRALIIQGVAVDPATAWELVRVGKLARAVVEKARVIEF